MMMLGRSPRAAYIMRVGVIRIGLPIGAIVFIAAVPDEYRTILKSLRSSAGWLRLLGVAVLCIGEWVLGAGWLIGAALWHGHEGARRERGAEP